jgi:hypothetical protein
MVVRGTSVRTARQREKGQKRVREESMVHSLPLSSASRCLPYSQDVSSSVPCAPPARARDPLEVKTQFMVS